VFRIRERQVALAARAAKLWAHRAIGDARPYPYLNRRLETRFNFLAVMRCLDGTDFAAAWPHLCVGLKSNLS
jgi:hypothetical protein